MSGSGLFLEKEARFLITFALQIMAQIARSVGRQLRRKVVEARE